MALGTTSKSRSRSSGGRCCSVCFPGAASATKAACSFSLRLQAVSCQKCSGAMSKVARAWESGAPTKVQVRPQQEVMKDGIAMIRKDMALRLFGGFDAEGTSLMLDGDAAAETRNDATHPSIARHARPVDFKAAEDEGHRFVVHAQRCCQQLRVPNTLVSVYDKNGVALGHLAEQDMGDYVCCDDDRDIAVMKVLDGNGKQVFALRRKSNCRDMFHVCGYLRLCGMPVCKPCESRPPMVLRCSCTIFPVMLSSACASCCVVAGISTDCCQPKPESRDSKCQSPCPKCEDQCGTWYGELCCCASCLPFALCVLPCIHCLEMEKICKCQLPEGTFCRSCLVEWPRDCFQCNCINPSSPCPASCCQVTKGTMATRPGLETFPIFYMCVIPNVKPVTRSFNLRESSKNPTRSAEFGRLRCMRTAVTGQWSQGVISGTTPWLSFLGHRESSPFMPSLCNR